MGLHYITVGAVTIVEEDSQSVMSALIEQKEPEKFVGSLLGVC